MQSNAGFLLSQSERILAPFQVRDIVDAERLNSHSQVATLWRHQSALHRPSVDSSLHGNKELGD